MIKFKKIKGIALPISLFVLMGVLLAAAALIRAGEFSVSLSGDVANRTMVSQANEIAVSTAQNWLILNQTTLNNDNVAEGYFSASPVGAVDYTQDASWINAKVLPADAYQNVSRYMILRMCTQPNTPYNGTNAGVLNECATKKSNSTANQGNSTGFQSFQFPAIPQVFYKILVKTEGPKGASTISETVLSLSN